MIKDQVGKETLDVIANADSFNKWMYETIKPYSKGTVLEIGSGIGNISKLFLKDNFKILLSDLRPEYCKILNEKFEKQKTFLGAIRIDLSHLNFENEYAEHLESYDTVFALNVVEHIQNDMLAITNCKKLLKPGGNLIILVPAFQALYNNFDKHLGHYKRYTSSDLKTLFIKNKFEIISTKFFNLAGIAGWYFSGKILRENSIPEGQMTLYNYLVPIFRIFDKIALNRIGLSVITVGRKT